MSKPLPLQRPAVLNRQFRLVDLFWIVTTLAAVLGYARYLGENAVAQAILWFVIAVFCGVLIGCAGGDWKNGLFWSCTITLLAFLAIAGGRLPNAAVVLGWCFVAAICGAMAGVQLPPSLWLGSFTSALLAASILMSAVVLAEEPLAGLVWFDVACAGLIGFLLRPFVQFLAWFERHSQQRRVLLVSWLVLAVVAGNAFVPLLAGVQR